MINKKETTKIIFEKYKTMMLNKKQTCEVINMSLSKMNKLIHEHKFVAIPKFKKVGNKYLFSISNVLEYLDSDIKVA